MVWNCLVLPACLLGRLLRRNQTDQSLLPGFRNQLLPTQTNPICEQAKTKSGSSILRWGIFGARIFKGGTCDANILNLALGQKVIEIFKCYLRLSPLRILLNTIRGSQVGVREAQLDLSSPGSGSRRGNKLRRQFL